MFGLNRTFKTCLRFQFRHTIKERAAASAVAYAEGAFPGEDVEMDPPLEDDTLLRVRENIFLALFVVMTSTLLSSSTITAKSGWRKLTRMTPPTWSRGSSRPPT